MNMKTILATGAIFFSHTIYAQITAKWTNEYSGGSFVREQGLIVGMIEYKEFIVTSGGGNINVLATLDVTGNSLTTMRTVVQGNIYRAELSLDLSGSRRASNGEVCLQVTFDSDAFNAPGLATLYALFTFPGTYSCPKNITISAIPYPPTLANDYGVNGLFVDLANDGNGFDFNVHEFGLTIFYYGHTASGERLWLISELFTKKLAFGFYYGLDMFEVINGTFGNSAQGETLWGTLLFALFDCDSVDAKLQGIDGTVEFDLVRLAGHHGSGCQ